VRPLVEHLFREAYGQLVSVLTGRFGLHRMAVAEDVAQETLMAALHHWPVQGVPDNPRAWLMRVARNKAINVIQSAVNRTRADDEPDTLTEGSAWPETFLRTEIEDSQLRLVFACCHPNLKPELQLALMLKTLGGLGTTEIARALLQSPDAVAKRLYRAREEIGARGIAMDVPAGAELQRRLETACRSLYLMFNEGYAATASAHLLSRDLCFEAMRLCHLLLDRFPKEVQISALYALMCFHAARFDARESDQGDLLLLAEQDRRLWDRKLITEGFIHLTGSARGERLTRYHLEASIAAQHCMAESFAATDWDTIRGLYEALASLQEDALIQLNLAIVSLQQGQTEAALAALQGLQQDKGLRNYPMLHAALADCHVRRGDVDAARGAYERALDCATSTPQGRFLQRRLRELKGRSPDADTI